MEGVSCYIVKKEEAKEAQDGRPSVGPVYRSIFAKDESPEPPPNLRTCWDLFNESVSRCPNNQMLGHRDRVTGKYVWRTYKEVYDIVIPIGSAMRTCGVNPKGRCGIYGVNCPEWLMTMEACNGHSIYCVPLYDTLGPNAVEFIVNHAEVEIAFVQETKLQSMLKSLPKCSDTLQTIVSFGAFPHEDRKLANNYSMATYSWEEFVKLGKDYPVELCPPKPQDISTIMYTSGTTGEPKGVLLTHESILDVIAAVDLLLDSVQEKMLPSDVYFSFLPLAHIFDRVIEEYTVRSGASIGFWRGDVKLIVEDVAELKPTIFAGVPRVFDRIYAGALQKITAGGSLRKTIFNMGYKYKLNSMMKGSKQDMASPLVDKIVFSKVKQGLGGRVRLILSGAAPLAKHVEEFLRVTTCAIVLQGYGLTETCAASFVSMPDVMSMLGAVGPPLPHIDVCLESVPEMNYDALAETPRGEVCIRGKCLFAGYHKREDLTNEVLLDGWFHTGDIGEWQPDGALKLIDRKKNIFKLSQGEYVAVENLENIFSLSHLVDSIWVYGNSFESSLVAVVVPNQVELEKWARSEGIEGDFNALCSNEKVKLYVAKDLDAVAKDNKLRGFEFLKGIHLEAIPFDSERDLLTPTYKKKRPQLQKYYKEIIDGLYESMKK